MPPWPSQVPTAQTSVLLKARTPSRMVFPLGAPGSGLGTVVQPPTADPYSISEAALVVDDGTLSPTAQASRPPLTGAIPGR